MTDNEIIKALECCMSDNPPCTTCKYDGDTITVDECMGELMKDALDLINRQKAEIEMWKSSAELWEGDARQFFNERQTARAEAIKELAERIKENTFTYSGEIRTYDAVMVKWIDKCVKEMVGDTE